MTLLGAAAPFIPLLEIINHFRPLVVLGAAVIAALAWISGSRAGFITSDTLKKGRRYAIVLAFVAAAVLTPPDVISQMALAVPTLVLYEASIFTVRYIENKRAADESAGVAQATTNTVGLARWLSVAVLAVNAGLLLMPLVQASATAPRSSLRITTFNLWGGHNQSAGEVVRFVAETGAEIVLMQEVDVRLEGALVPALRSVYPYAVSCAERNCGLLLLSKREPVASGASDRTSDEPPLVWARFSAADGRDFTVSGVHLAWPFEPEWQARQIESLVTRFDHAEGTQIIAGDFNLSPFSWKLNRLSAATGLRRHATFAASWPAFPLFPVLLLDNLLSTPDVRSAGVSIGSSGYGSDHRPVTFDLALD